MKNLKASLIIGALLCGFPTLSTHVYKDVDCDSIIKSNESDNGDDCRTQLDEEGCLIGGGNVQSFIQKSRNERKRKTPASPLRASKSKIANNVVASIHDDTLIRQRNVEKRPRTGVAAAGHRGKLHEQNRNLRAKGRKSRSLASNGKRDVGTTTGNRIAHQKAYNTKTSNIRQHSARSVKTNPSFDFATRKEATSNAGALDSDDEEDSDDTEGVDGYLNEDEDSGEDGIDDDLSKELAENQDGEDEVIDDNTTGDILDLFDTDEKHDESQSPKQVHVNEESFAESLPDEEEEEESNDNEEYQKPSKMSRLRKHSVDDSYMSLSPLDSMRTTGKTHEGRSKNIRHRNHANGRLP
ncbi:hypothetical protein X943_000239 [Babesia divergens]|uniref:Uncharacterized protein n=1 Tax=Babesia divergens TaxID=32595 RepID=A0AAD9LI38_BABDI|nr:hypothetical protein X943_000239 [Babesia divergens]